MDKPTTNNEIALELLSIVEFFEETDDLATALERIDMLIVRLWSDDGTTLSNELKEKIFFNS